MMMGITYHRKAMGIGSGSLRDGVARMVFHRVLRVPSLRTVTIIDEAFYRYARAAAVAEYDKLAYVPDIGLLEGMIPKSSAREFLGIGNDRFVVLVYGALSARKGIAELIAATASAASRRVVLLLAGSADEEAESILRSSDAQLLAERGQILRSPGFHDGRREAAVFSAADVVWVGYVGFFGSSGVLYQAGAAGLPVIAASDGQLGWLTTTYGLGVCCNPCDLSDVNFALETLMNRPDLASEYGARGKAHSEGHSPSHFARAICDAIERGAIR
jgi:glycosyltransferase involved in cell wall biosynthesis